MTKKIHRKTGLKGRGGPGRGGGRPPHLPDIAPLADRQEIAVQARKYAHQAIACLLDVIANGKTDTARVSASIYLLNRGYGSPPQEISLANKGDEALRIDQSFVGFVDALQQLAKTRAVDSRLPEAKLIEHAS